MTLFHATGIPHIGISHQVESEKWFIMSIFMRVPSLVVKRLHREAEKGAARLRAQLDSEGVGDESDHEADDEVSSKLPH